MYLPPNEAAPPIYDGFLIVSILILLVGRSFRPLTVLPLEPVPSIPPEKWLEIQEELWTASNLARIEAQNYARVAMQEWMMRVRENTDSECVPWYTSYWAQQWIGLKIGWYEMGKEDGEPAVE